MKTKIRLWDKVLGKMIYDENGGSPSHPILYAIGLHGRPIAIDKDSFKEKEIKGWNIDHNRIAMFWTGLTDKNGKEIYEGDILKFLYNGGVSGGVLPYHEETCLVSWNNDDWGFRIERLKKGTPYFHQSFLIKSEVIGNIYENPELLKIQDSK